MITTGARPAAAATIRRATYSGVIPFSKVAPPAGPHWISASICAVWVFPGHTAQARTPLPASS